MCGRYAVGIDAETIQERYFVNPTFSFDETYNAAPQQQLPVITRETTTQAERASWGFQPTWADESHTGFINARIETVDEKQSFRTAWQQQRCLVPATGFFEWQGNEGGKTPYYFHTDQDVFSFAGIWNTNKKGEISYAIITRPANDDVDDVHDRMPVILDKEEEGSWLVTQLGKQRLLGPRQGLSSHPVTKAVNSPQNDGQFLTEERDGLHDFTS